MAAVFVVGGVALVGASKWVSVPGASVVIERRSGAPALSVLDLKRLPADGALRERLVLSDPRPLFLPDDGVAVSVGDDPASVISAGRAAEAEKPALRFAEKAPVDGVLRPVAPGSAAEAVALIGAPRWFLGMARRGEPAGAQPGSPGRVARVEVYRANEAGKIAAIDVFRAEGLDSVVWKPLTLTVLVEAAGPIARPAVAVGSGVDEVDERIRWIVGRELLPTLSLRPGVYRFEVGP